MAEQTPKQTLLIINTELNRRAVQPLIKKVARWAMITRKMQKEEQSTDKPINLCPILTKLNWNWYAVPYDDYDTYFGAGLIPTLSRLVKYSQERELHQVVGTICQISSSNGVSRDACATGGAIPVLIDLVLTNEGSCGEWASMAIKDLACHWPVRRACFTPEIVSKMKSILELIPSPKYNTLYIIQAHIQTALERLDGIYH